MTAETPRSPFADLEALARTWIWPRGEARERFRSALIRATEEDVTTLLRVVARLDRVVVALASPLDFPTRLVDVRADGTVNASELEEMVPGDYVEIVGARPAVGAVHTYPFSEDHSTLVFEAMEDLRRVTVDLRRVLAEPSDRGDALAATLAAQLSDLSEDVRKSLAARSPGADPEAARRRKWLDEVTDWLERGAPADGAPPTLPPTPEAVAGSERDPRPRRSPAPPPAGTGGEMCPDLAERSDSAARSGTASAPRRPSSRLPHRAGEPDGPVLAAIKPDGTLFLDLDALTAYVRSLERLTDEQDRELRHLQRRVEQQDRELEHLRTVAWDAGPDAGSDTDQVTDDRPAKGDPR